MTSKRLFETLLAGGTLMAATGMAQAQLLGGADLGATAPTPGYYDISQLQTTGDTIQLQEAMVASPSPIDRCSSSSSSAGLNTCRILAAIDALPADEREAFNLVRIQGMSPADVAEVIGVTTRTFQRRLNRGLSLLERQLDDLLPATPPSDVPLERSSGAMLA